VPSGALTNIVIVRWSASVYVLVAFDFCTAPVASGPSIQEVMTFEAGS
jgi:hypothetical protein